MFYLRMLKVQLDSIRFGQSKMHRNFDLHFTFHTLLLTEPLPYVLWMEAAVIVVWVE